MPGAPGKATRQLNRYRTAAVANHEAPIVEYPEWRTADAQRQTRRAAPTSRLELARHPEHEPPARGDRQWSGSHDEVITALRSLGEHKALAGFRQPRAWEAEAARLGAGGTSTSPPRLSM